MRLRIFVEPQQGSSYERLLAMARAAEHGGFDAFFRSDHYLRMGDADGLPGPTDAWITLAGLSRDTTSIRLGVMMSSATFRQPGALAITVAQIDAMSGGRIELGLGTGWYEAEHRAYGIPFPAASERFERFEEQLEIIRGLWTTPIGKSFDFHGRWYMLENSPGLPKPLQSPYPPVIVGGVGHRRTPRLAARFADEFNVPFPNPDDARAQFDRVRAACEQIGRDPEELRYSVALTTCCGTTQAEIERRALAIGRPVEELRSQGACGTPEEVVARFDQWRQAGAETIYVQLMDDQDLDHVSLLARDVLAKLQ